MSVRLVVLKPRLATGRVGINAFRAMTGSLVGNVGAKHLSWATMPTETNSFEKFQKYLFHIRLLHPVIPCTMLTVSTDF